MNAPNYREALYLAICLARHTGKEAGIERDHETGYRIYRLPAPEFREAYHDRMEKVRPTDPLPDYRLPWLHEYVVETAREAIFADRCRGVPGGVYEPFLKHPEWEAASLSLLVCAGPVAEHSNSEEMPGHCHSSVILNDGFIARRPDDHVDELPPQKAGDFFHLNVHDEHELTTDWRVDPADIDGSFLGYAVLVLSSSERLDEWEQRIQMTLMFRRVARMFENGVPRFHNRR